MVTREKLASIRKLNLSATFNSYGLVLLHFRLKQIEHLYFVTKSNHYLKSAWVNSYSIWLIGLFISLFNTLITKF